MDKYINKFEKTTHTELKGEAPKQYNKKSVTIEGTISSPVRFAESRSEQIDFKRAHVLVSKSSGTITMFINEQSFTDFYTIEGKVEISQIFKELGINSGNGSEPKQMSKLFRLKRSLFPSPTEHTELVSKLRNVKAKVNKVMANSEDDRGNKRDLFEQTVESSLPENFILKIPLIEGEEPIEVEVHVIVEIMNGTEIICFLESIEAQEKIDLLVGKLVEEQVAKIPSEIAVIYV